MAFIEKNHPIMRVLITLEKRVNVFTLLAKEGKSHNPHVSYQDERDLWRDSMIYCFKQCVDLFWKYLKKELEEKHLTPEIKAPAEVIRKSCSARLITETEAETVLNMIKDRNMTSHMYVEEIAEILAGKIPAYYKLMHSIVQRIKP